MWQETRRDRQSRRAMYVDTDTISNIIQIVPLLWYWHKVAAGPVIRVRVVLCWCLRTLARGQGPGCGGRICVSGSHYDWWQLWLPGCRDFPNHNIDTRLRLQTPRNVRRAGSPTFTFRDQCWHHFRDWWLNLLLVFRLCFIYFKTRMN